MRPICSRLLLLLYICAILVFESVATTQFQPCDGVPSVPQTRRACNLFIWDAPSALLYKWCHHLLKDHLIEGKGGRMYVRIESNSILQLLYPCSRYSPNRCLVCGGSYADHLELWWSKNQYTPFDRHLDKTYNNALTIAEPRLPARTSSSPSSRSKSKTSRKSKTPTQPTQPIISGPPTFTFHKQYVQDIGDLLKEEKDQTKLREKVIQKYVPPNRQQSLEGWTMRTFPYFEAGYLVPPATQQEDQKRLPLGLRIIRSIVLGRFDDFVRMQEFENMKTKESR